VEVVSAADAASLTEAGNVVLEEKLSVAVLVSAILLRNINTDEVASVAVEASATKGVNTAPASVVSEAVAVSEVDTA
jgi:hypothetical protein